MKVGNGSAYQLKTRAREVRRDGGQNEFQHHCDRRFHPWNAGFTLANQQKSCEKTKQQPKELDHKKLSDENVVTGQAEFERHLDESADLPYGIHGRKAYIYRKLMSKWFETLTTQRRYDEPMAHKIKSDWLSYMKLLESQSTSNLEAGTEIGRDGRRALEEYNQCTAIKNAFAAAVGNEAIDELRRVRDAPLGGFDRSGRKPMAPMGYRYAPVSFTPIAKS
jgi:hypothetical protein